MNWIAGRPANDPVKGWQRVTIGVASLEKALDLWQGLFGFELHRHAFGPDPGLQSYWGLTDQHIARQAVVGAPGQARGQLHLVEFTPQKPSIRHNASVFDRCAKNLDIYVDDLPKRLEALRSAGVEFRTRHYHEIIAPSGVRFREIHMPAHDDLNVVLLQLLDAAIPVSHTGFGGVGPLVTIVDDVSKESGFYQEVLNLDLQHDNVLSGPDIEQMIGLPCGAALKVVIWGEQGHHHGQVEIINYEGTVGRDLFAAARPGDRGIFQLGFQVTDLSGVQHTLERLEHPFEHRRLESDFRGAKTSIITRSPAGLRIEITQN